MSGAITRRDRVQVTRVIKRRAFCAVRIGNFGAAVQHLGETWQDFRGVGAMPFARETAGNLNRAYELGLQKGGA